MNSVVLLGRLTRTPEIRYTQGERQMAIARFTLAVDRRGRKDNQDQTADFIPCIAFDKQAEFAEKYLNQGTKIALRGHIQTGSYTNKEGAKVYTTDVIVDEMEFAESKASTGQAPEQTAQKPQPKKPDSNGFMVIDDVSDEGLPWN